MRCPLAASRLLWHGNPPRDANIPELGTWLLLVLRGPLFPTLSTLFFSFFRLWHFYSIFMAIQHEVLPEL